MKKLYLLAIFTCIGLLPLAAQEDEPQSKDAAAAEMARKLQDPLAYIKALMTDNDFLFKTGQNDDFSFSSSIQPLKAWSFDEAGFNFIARGVIPILGLAPERFPGILPEFPATP